MHEILQYLEPGVVLASAVWAIATIKGTTERLGERIDELGAIIRELKDSIGSHKQDLDALKERVIKLEILRGSDGAY